ncbi:hypothetical protein RB653_001243 [Dictyostelium firmibasis]|uniref:Ras-GAP domain-containing protein n=1 Tax=Dictyostelium firmibasis TaxID=79012 RepID=A0AAN7U3W0_9MYCE
MTELNNNNSNNNSNNSSNNNNTDNIENQQNGSNNSAVVFGSKYKHNLRSTVSIEKTPHKYNDIIELLLSPDLEIVSSLCSTTLVRETVPNSVHISEYLIVFFEYHCNLKSSYILKWAIDKEIENTSNSATLFRGLSTATRLISAFYKRVGESYLKYLLQPFVIDLCSRNFSFEIDPEKAGKGVNIQANLEKLITITQKLLDKILDSVDQCPLPIRQILNHTQEKVEKRFKSMKTTVVGGFIFLRFICPAIVAPEAFGLIPREEEPTSETRRGLVLVSKLLQNLANEMPFGSGIKEEYMSYLNDFITNNSSRIHVFFDSLAQDPTQHQQQIQQLPPLQQPCSSTSTNLTVANNNNNNNINNHNNNSNSNCSSNNTSSNSIGSGVSTPKLTSTPSLGSVQQSSGNYNEDLNGNSISKSNSIIMTEDSITDNLNVLMNQIIENREKIENYIQENGNNDNSADVIKRLDTSLQAAKQKAFFNFWGRGKDKSSTGGSGTTTTNGKLKKSPSASVVSNSSHIQQLQEKEREKEKEKEKDKEKEKEKDKEKDKEKHEKHSQKKLQLSQSQQILVLDGVNINGNGKSLLKNHPHSQSHNQLSEELEMRDQKEIDNLNLMAENSKLKKELEDAKARNNLLRKLREELEREKSEKRELKALIKRCNDRLKSLDDQLDLIHDLQPWVDDNPPSGNHDLQSLIEETLGVGGGNASKKKSNSSLGISKVKSSSGYDTAPTTPTHTTLSSSTTMIPSITNAMINNINGNGCRDTTLISATSTPTISIIDNGCTTTASSLQPSPQPHSQPVILNHSTNYIPHLDVSCDSNNSSTTSSFYNNQNNQNSLNTTNTTTTSIKKSSTNQSISESLMSEISEADETKSGSNISISSATVHSTNTHNGKPTTTTTSNHSRRNSTTSEMSVADPTNYENQNLIIQTVVEGGEILDDSACDLLEFLKEVATKQELQKSKERQRLQEEKENKARNSVFFKFSSKFSSKKKSKDGKNQPLSPTLSSQQHIEKDSQNSGAALSLNN